MQLCSDDLSQAGRFMSDACKPGPNAPWSSFYGPEGWCQAEEPSHHKYEDGQRRIWIMSMQRGWIKHKQSHLIDV